MKLISDCLLGVKCRYDGKSKPCQKALDLAEKETLIPICPEQLGGLPTPRVGSENIDGKVMTSTKVDVTENYKRGAEETLKIAGLYGCKSAIFKQRSPSCGCGQIYEGTFSGTVIEGDGLTTKLLKEKDIEVMSEDDL